MLITLRDNNYRVLTLKDFTTVLTMPHDKRSEVLAQLREIYDGYYRKQFGNGKVVDWAGKLGLIAGVTPVIDVYSAVNQVLGERFVNYRIRSEAVVDVAQRAINNQGQEKTMREALTNAVTLFFESLSNNHPGGMENVNVELPLSLVTKIACLSSYCATARSSVIRNGKGQIEFITEPEGPGRLAKQFALFSKALAVVRGKTAVTEAEYALAYRLAQDTLPRHKHITLEALMDSQTGEWLTLETAEIAKRTNYPGGTAKNYLVHFQETCWGIDKGSSCGQLK